MMNNTKRAPNGRHWIGDGQEKEQQGSVMTDLTPNIHMNPKICHFHWFKLGPFCKCHSLVYSLLEKSLKYRKNRAKQAFKAQP